MLRKYWKYTDVIEYSIYKTSFDKRIDYIKSEINIDLMIIFIILPGVHIGNNVVVGG